ncbi:MAG: 3-methyl-2-oxobutanoate hydroxymethyltransferase [Thermoplasmata archaeon]|nr:MAG: 3-methyl-2-oxobutanoate hydroxymethyltransferase [Thermoplasmata archaeon]
MSEKITVRDIIKKKGKEKIIAITSYDYPTTLLIDSVGVDLILVGDSLGMTVLGYDSTLPVTLEDMIRHTAAVARARPRALVVTDMPFMTYESSKRDALVNAAKLLRAGAEAVKIEGGIEYADTIETLVNAGIPVLGHIGLTPQRKNKLGGYRLMGKDPESAEKVLEDAKAVEEAGAFAVVIEFTTAEVTKVVTEMLKIPTIGIGSGPYCDGQIIVIHDIIGLTQNPPPFAKKYVDVSPLIVEGVRRYKEEVLLGKFPSKEHYWHAPNDVRAYLKKKYERDFYI